MGGGGRGEGRGKGGRERKGEGEMPEDTSTRRVTYPELGKSLDHDCTVDVLKNRKERRGSRNKGQKEQKHALDEWG
jgi:hypothetical protein